VSHLPSSCLTGISQRDTNYYEFLNQPETQRKIVSSFVEYWTKKIKQKWIAGPNTSCKFLIVASLITGITDRPDHRSPMFSGGFLCAIYLIDK
jgi:hypothetical protein